jgi:GNAT superfamily N-acetyltransferase
MNKVEIMGYVPGAIGRITELHATYYAKHWEFGLFFEAKVATEMSEFLSRFDDRRDGFWTTCLDGRVEGSIAIDGIKAESEGAHLRWFITSSRLKGRGCGNTLMKAAVDFCRMKKYSTAYLWTFEGLDAARHLYEKFGFSLTEEHTGTQWGTRVREQKFVLNF